MKKTPKLIEGYERQWIKCNKCDSVYYYDFIPYSSSVPIRTLPCKHDFNKTIEITFDEFNIEIINKKSKWG